MGMKRDRESERQLWEERDEGRYENEGWEGKKVERKEGRKERKQEGREEGLVFRLKFVPKS